MEGKITMEFNCPEQESNARMAMDGARWYFAFMEVRENIRRQCKYAEEEKLFSDEELYKMFGEAIENNNLPFEY
jgi:hypothetical protein